MSDKEDIEPYRCTCLVGEIIVDGFNLEDSQNKLSDVTDAVIGIIDYPFDAIIDTLLYPWDKYWYTPKK